MKQIRNQATPKKNGFWAVDERALGLFRIAFACLILLDWIDRWSYRANFISAFGLTPVTLAISKVGIYSLVDFFAFTQNANLVNLYLLFGLTAYIFLLLGLYTKTACICSLLFYSSLVATNPLIRNFGDPVIALSLLWGSFAGLGSRFSLDSLFKFNISRSHFGKQVIYTQFAFIILGAGLAKTGATWQEGTALSYVLSSPVLASSWGQSLIASSPEFLTKLFCYSSLAIEIVCPILLLFPCVPILWRGFSVILLGSLWIGISLFLSIGIGPWIMLASTLIFFDTRLINLFTPANTIKDKPPVKNSLLLSFIQAPLALIALSMFLNFAVGTRYSFLKKEMPEVFLIPFSLLSVTQEWIMFAPDPAMMTQWPQVVAKLKDGREIDVISGKTPDTTTIVLPDRLPRIKRKYFEFIAKTDNFKYRSRLLSKLCEDNGIFYKIDSPVVSANFILIKKKLYSTAVNPEIGPLQPDIQFEEVDKIECSR